MLESRITESSDRIIRRSTTPQPILRSSESFSHLNPRSETPSRKSFASEKYHQRSTVFDATFEQSSIDQGYITPTHIRTNLSRSPTKLRETRTFASTVFLPPEPTGLTVSPYKPKDHSVHDLFGSEETDYYNKKITIQNYEPNFQPKYKEINPSSTKNQDMYGKTSDFCVPKGELEEILPSNLTAKDVYVRRHPTDREMSPSVRKSLDAVSQVFPKSEKAKENETQRIVKFAEKPENNIKLVNEDEKNTRKIREHNSVTPKLRRSSKFEESQSSPALIRLIKKTKDYEPSIEKRETISRSTKENYEEPKEEIKSIKKSQSNNFPVVNIIAKELKRRELNLTNIEYVKDESRLEDFELTGLTPNTDERSIRDLCKGVHVVNITPKYNNITGECEGSAILSVRYQPQYKSIENLKLNCIEKGLTLSPSKKDVGKKNNYAELSTRRFLDNFLKAEERRIVDKYATPRVQRPDLVSSDDVYGSSPGVGRTSYFTPRAPDKFRATIESWSKVKNATPSKSPIRSVSKPRTANFMKNTVSSCNKVKKL